MRTCKTINGKLVWDPPFTKAEEAANRRKFAEMCETRTAPNLNGVNENYLRGQVIHHGIGHLPMFMQQQIIGQAKAAGIDITGKVYRAGLADRRGSADPEAWVSDTGDVLAVCKRRNLSAEGIVNHKGHAVHTEDVPLADGIIKGLAREYVAKDPKLAKDPHELREMIVEKHGAPANKRSKGNIGKRHNIDAIPHPDDPD